MRSKIRLAARPLRRPSCVASVPLRMARRIRSQQRRSDSPFVFRRRRAASARLPCGGSDKCPDWWSNPEPAPAKSTSETLMATARARKKVPVTPVIEISGRNTTMGVSVEPISGTVSSLSALLVASSGPSPPSRCRTMFSTTTMASSITSPPAAASPPSVIMLKLWPMIFITMKVTQDGHRNHQARHQRRAPIAQEQPDDEPGEEQPDDDRVAHAADRFPDDVGLIVKNVQLDAGGKRRPNAFDFLVHFVGHFHGVAVRLAVDADQHRRLCRSR